MGSPISLQMEPSSVAGKGQCMRGLFEIAKPPNKSLVSFGDKQLPAGDGSALPLTVPTFGAPKAPAIISGGHDAPAIAKLSE